MSRSRGRLLFGLVLVVAMLSPAGVAVAAAAGNSTATTSSHSGGNHAAQNWTAPGPYTLQDLRTGGTHPSEAPKSVRMIGDPTRGSVAVRYTPVSPLRSQQQFLAPGQTLQTDTIQLYSTAFGNAAGKYQLVIVYYTPKTKLVKTRNGSQRVPYAANQTVQRVGVNIKQGYATADVGLYSHYDGKVHATMWLERNGHRVSGARWHFVHHSNPLTAAPPFAVNSKGDLWRWAAMSILLPALPGLFIGRMLASHLLERTIVGPQKSGIWWLIVLGVLALVAVAAATFQSAAVLAHAPWVAGVFIALVSFVAFLGFRDTDVERAEFQKKNIEDVVSVRGEDSVQATTETRLLRDIVRRNGNIYMPSPGIRPFFARYWADPANIDESDLTTVTNTEGDVSKVYEIDPDADYTIRHRPARMSFAPSILTPKADDEPDTGGDNLPVPAADGGTAPSAPRSFVDDIVSTLGRLNWGFLAPAVGGGAAVYFGVNYVLGTPALSGLLALVPAVIAGYHAVDGDLDFELAPRHFSEAEAILATERAKYREAKTFEDLHGKLADLDLDLINETQDTVEALREQLRERIQEMFDMPEGGSSINPPMDSEVNDD